MSASWRDGLPAEVLADIDTLFGTGLGVAQEQLADHGAFLPAALVTTHDGGLRLVVVSPDDLDAEAAEVNVDGMIEDLYATLRQERGDFRAVAVISDIFLPEEDADAIQIAVEHSTGVAVSAIQPYHHDDDGKWSYPDPFVDPQERLVWPDAVEEAGPAEG
ncbi:hypothetical protein E4J89_16005 [Arthrobacter sp. CAU 1506]|uniref:hypothetical protein n=1 Tax=Arthrobacter sp. CAU 1506 TaxID=2560052 RepID=UPI0010AC7BEE|nr:hypothetical protein [Arthrobacter sp. CAU 1506]TJY67211.1 hypothetical protein E4J89_16005 [Arthrobacter sp. CAU 1506]